MRKPTFETVMARLKEALKASTFAEVGRYLGLTTSAYANRKRSGSLPFETLLPFADSRNISADWLLFGIGTPFRDSDERVAPIAEIDPKLLASIYLALLRAMRSEPPTQQEELEATRLAGLASLVYNRVAGVPDGAARDAFIRNEAHGFARAARILQPE
ncbi:MAG TPA: helix-turn-helix domain-containing protein [Tahibacter sp.]|uniref:helix-turn-helix domain-containing protein n=1 Tax=Tahibacter sp. TaxID=2056211 RepID=UPI002BBBA091|nr:helix-turn-helix domain-containing protein [Tahibacter sp.]HSX60245.1 helix-turn-helix domain-containing protein [Tahibacter sp.]